MSLNPILLGKCFISTSKYLVELAFVFICGYGTVALFWKIF